MTASSAVNLPITRASLRLGVIWMGVRSIRCTYSVARVLPRFTFHNKFCVHDFHKCLKCCQALKEVLAMHGPRSSPSIDPVFPNSHEVDIQPFFSGHSNFGYGRLEHTHDRQMEACLSRKPMTAMGSQQQASAISFVSHTSNFFRSMPGCGGNLSSISR